MITTLKNYNSSMYATTYKDIYNGVVRVSNGVNMGTGILLYDGKSVLTAAHIFEGYDTLNVTASFDTNNNPLTYRASADIYENYDTINVNGDLAILTLSEFAPSLYKRSELYRDTDELSQNFTMVGYGVKGSGDTGILEGTDNTTKLITQNTFETDMETLARKGSINIAFEPLKDSILVADFDSGVTDNDALNYYLGIKDLGLGDTEGMIASGDSGGPALINDKIAGIASYSISSSSLNSPDINKLVDSSFGELGAWTRVSYYQEWIDKTIRSNYKDAPVTSNEVETSIIENHTGTQYTYFLLEILGDRSNLADTVTWDYITIDGTATASQDYIPVSGSLTLYSDETSIAIPVEIIGDRLAEEDETFYLQVTNSDITLTAMRTILDDDGFIA